MTSRETASNRIAAALLVATLLAPRLAAAQAKDEAAAEALFREGKRLLALGSLAQACSKLDESHRLDPATGTLLALAACREQEGRTATAWAEYNDAAARARRDGRGDRERVARERAASLEAKLSKLTVVVSEDARTAPGLVVQSDGVALGQAAWGTPIPVDPGDHLVEATATGKAPWHTTVRVGAEGDDARVAIAWPAEQPVTTTTEEPPKQSENPTARRVTDDPHDANSSRRTQRTLGWTVAGAGAVSLAVGVYFWAQAGSLLGERNRICPNWPACADPAAASDKDNAARRDIALGAATVATGLLGVGLGTWLVVESGQHPQDPAVTVSLAPAGVMVRGLW
jgi:hypothetical protein